MNLYICFRIETCISQGRDGDISVSLDGGYWYEQKKRNVKPAIGVNARCQEVPILPISGWKRFPSRDIPDSFNKGYIYHYIYESAKFDKPLQDQVSSHYGTEKPFERANQYIDSKYVTTMMDHSSEKCYFVKAKVKSSLADKFYSVHCTISKLSGAVLDASCHCKASAMARCSHIAALLLSINDHIQCYGYTLASCTSLPCTWNTPKSLKKKPSVLKRATYTTKSKFEQDKNDLFNFHPASKVKKLYDVNNRHNAFLTNLTNCEGLKTGWETLMSYQYQDYELTEQREQELNQSRDIFLRNMQDLSNEERVHTMVNNSDTSYLVPETVTQNDSAIWRNRRSFCITASIAKDVVQANSKISKKNILQNHLWGKDVLSTKAMCYGNENESNARNQYEIHMKTENSNIEVRETGFWVSINTPELGCSPDGIVRYIGKDGEIEYGLLEIKCPYVFRDINPTDIQDCKRGLSRQQQTTFCCKILEDRLELKKTHKYYYQVQLQIYILDFEWCDFVIWSKRGIHIERIQRNESFIKDMIPKLLKFHHSILLPEFFEQRIPRDLDPFELK